MCTATGEYALRAMIYIAREGRSKLTREISKELSIPERYLGKVLSTLTQMGLLIAKRGREGGFSLREPAESIDLFKILEAVGCSRRFEECILGDHPCLNEKPCPMHEAWGEFKVRILDLLKGVTLQDVIRGELNQQVAFNYLRIT